MPRGRAGLAPLVAVVVFGCAPAPEPVSVDLAALPQATAQAPTPADVPTSSGDSVSPMTVRLGAVPARDLTFGESKARLDAALKLVEQSRAVAYEQVLRSLRESYRAEAQRWTTERMAQLKNQADARYDAAFESLRSAFDAYAFKRGPLVARLAALAGFPDPDPKSLAKVDPEKPQTVRRANETSALRKQLQALDAAFAAEARKLLQAAGLAVATDQTRLQAEIGAAMREADLRAEATAAEQMLRTRAVLDALLAQRTGVSLEEEDAVELQLSQSSRTDDAPAVMLPSATVVGVKEELEMWLRVRGYRLAPAGKGVRDATEEFATWRATHKVGR